MFDGDRKMKLEMLTLFPSGCSWLDVLLLQFSLRVSSLLAKLFSFGWLWLWLLQGADPCLSLGVRGGIEFGCEIFHRLTWWGKLGNGVVCRNKRRCGNLICRVTMNFAKEIVLSTVWSNTLDQESIYINVQNELVHRGRGSVVSRKCFRAGCVHCSDAGSNPG